MLKQIKIKCATNKKLVFEYSFTNGERFNRVYKHLSGSKIRIVILYCKIFESSNAFAKL